MNSQKKIINELRFQLDSKEVKDQHYPVQLSASDANAILALLKEQGKPDCEHAEHDGIGCLGYAGCTQDDEPIESCKRCEKYTGNVYEAVKWNELEK